VTNAHTKGKQRLEKNHNHTKFNKSVANKVKHAYIRLSQYMTFY